MQRVAFLLQIKPGKISEYEAAHRQVWPELIREMEDCGITEYSIFRHGLQLFLSMRVENFEAVKRRLFGSAVNRRWQDAMAPLLDVIPEMLPGESFTMMEEVFYMPGNASTEQRSGSGEE